MGQYAHVVWDWNGTLLDDVSACLIAINRILVARGHDAVDRTQYREVFGFPIQGYYEKLGFDFEVEDWDTLAREFHDHYAETARTAPLHEGIVDVLSSLQDQGAGLSVLSASETSVLNTMVKERGIFNFFDAIRGIDDLYGASKLDAGRSHMQELGIPAAQVLLVGDTTHDFDVAQEMECHCVLVGSGHQSLSRLAACGCPVVPTARDLEPWLMERACRR